MLKIVGRLSGALIRLLGLSLLTTAVIAAVVALRHMLDTPQQLESRSCDGPRRSQGPGLVSGRR